MLRVKTSSADDTRKVASAVAALLQPRDTLLLAGDLGAGKTAFTQGLAAGLGVYDQVTSPTFTLVRTYAGRMPLVHVDVYRLDDMQEFVDLGVAELQGDEGIAVIEWGDAAEPALPADFLEVVIEFAEDAEARTIGFRSVGAAWAARQGALAAALEPWGSPP